MSWVDRAECAGMDTDIFFPINQRSSVSAKEVCLRCRVKRDCLTYGLSMEQPGHRFGVYGGLLPSERDRGRYET